MYIYTKYRACRCAWCRIARRGRRVPGWPHDATPTWHDGSHGHLDTGTSRKDIKETQRAHMDMRFPDAQITIVIWMRYQKMCLRCIHEVVIKQSCDFIFFQNDNIF